MSLQVTVVGQEVLKLGMVQGSNRLVLQTSVNDS